MAEPQLTFLVREPGLEPRRVTTPQGVVKIGRNANLPLGLSSAQVSRMHAVIEVQDGGAIVLIDLGSEPKTTVNGEPVDKASLRPGDRIGIADCELVLEAVGEHVAAPSAGAWNWGDAPPQRKERSSAGPIVVLALVLLGVIGYLLLK